jgi:hypothetical protein
VQEFEQNVSLEKEDDLKKLKNQKSVLLLPFVGIVEKYVLDLWAV